jgi:hypothetical protein
MLDSPVSSMVVHEGQVVVLTDDYRVFRFQDQHWSPLGIEKGKKPFLQRVSERTGDEISSITLMPGPGADPWVAASMSRGEDATVQMYNTHLVVYAVGRSAWRTEQLPKSLDVPPPNQAPLSAATIGPPAFCSGGTEGWFCLTYEQRGWHLTRMDGLTQARSIRWSEGALHGICSADLTYAVDIRDAGRIDKQKLDVPNSLGAVEGYWGTAKDFWVWNGSKLAHNQTILDSPVGDVNIIWALSPSEVWVGGADGLAYSDGTELKRVAGVFGSITHIVGTSDSDIWFAGPQGAYRTQVAAVQYRVLPAVQASGAIISSQVHAMSSAKVLPLPGKLVALRNPGRPDFSNALFVQAADARMLFVNFEGIYSYDLRSSSVQRQADAPEIRPFGSSVVEKDNSPCTARFGDTRRPYQLGVHRAEGDVQAWLDLQRQPVLNRCKGNELTRVALIDLRTNDIALADSGHVWLAGEERRQGTEAPVEEHDSKGLLLDWSENQTVTYQVNEGPLYAVSTWGDTTWAAGADGLVARVKKGKLDLFQLEPKVTLWDALSDATGVWIVGDGRDLMHFDGRNLVRYQSTLLRQPLTGIARDSKGDLWLVGPRTLFRGPSLHENHLADSQL